MRRILFLCLVGSATLLVFSGCKASGQRRLAAPLPDRPGTPPSSVVFDIASADPARNKQGASVWNATYTSEGRTARFRIELVVKNTTRPTESDFPVSFGEGRFVATANSDATILLRDLAKALEAKTIPKNVRRSAVLLFEFVILGEHQSRVAEGGFSDDPRGDWTPMKIFLGPPGDEEGEVFLNLNPVLRKGEFSIKDSDYGDIVLRELARVL